MGRIRSTLRGGAAAALGRQGEIMINRKIFYHQLDEVIECQDIH